MKILTNSQGKPLIDTSGKAQQAPSGNWILDKRTASSSVGITLSEDEVSQLVAQPACNALFQYCPWAPCSFDFKGYNSASAHWQFQAFMKNCGRKANVSSACVDVTFSTLTTTGAYERVFSDFAHTASAIKSLSFPALTSVGGSYAFAGCIQSSHCETFSAPLLESVTANQAFNGFAYYDSRLTSVDLGSLQTITYTSTGYPFTSAFTGCSSLVNMRIHPGALKYSEYRVNPMGTATTVENLTLTATATDNVYLDKNTALTSASVLEVLNHLSTDSGVTGKTCAFANLTISSSDTNYAAISAKVSALTNWTITGLTL